MPKNDFLSIMDELGSLTDRYLTSDINGASVALSEAEQLMRGRGSHLPSSGFALAVILAKRSDIESELGNRELASSLMEEALTFFSKDALGTRSGLCTEEAVLEFVRKQETTGVRWRQWRSNGYA
jgi:hypothetical protein